MQKDRLNLAIKRGVVVLLAAGVTGGALAQDGGRKRLSSQIEEIIVSAQKREQSTADLGISVSALSGEDMSRLNMQTSNDIVNSIPNIEHTAIFGPGTNPNYSIRGVTMNDFNDATEAPIATYIDGVYFVTTGAGSFPLYDMERVEVLRGPQGTLFGRNSTGGVMHFISADPSEEFSGEVKLGVGSYDTRRASGHLNLPISDKFQVRIAGYTTDNDGWMKHRTGNQPDGGENNSESFRISLAFQPTDTIENVLKYSLSEAKGHTTAAWRDSVTINENGLLETLPEGTIDGFGVAPVHTYKEADHGNPRELKLARSETITNNFEWSVSESVTLTSVTGYNEYSRDLVEDCDGAQEWICATHYDNGSHQFSQELRAFIDLGEQRYTVGAYYLEQNQRVNQIAPLVVSLGGGGLLLDSDADQDVKGIAVFANAEFDLSEKFTLVTGVRVSNDEKEMDSRYAEYGSANPDLPISQQWLGYTETTDITDQGVLLGEGLLNDATGYNVIDKDSWNAKVELDYKPSDDMLIYGSISRGTKAPGFNHGFISTALAPQDYFYDEEELMSYELGLKTTFWDNRANFNGAIFYYDYSDYHALSFEGVGSFLTNRDAKLWGGEFDLTVKPTEGLTLALNAGVLESELYDVPDLNGNLGDWEMPIAPSYTVSGSINYEFYVGENILGLQLDGRGRDSFTNDPVDNPASVVGSYAVANARAYLLDADDKWEVSVSVQNLTDKEYDTSIFIISGLGPMRYGFFGPPRWWSADVTYRF